jgi:hypothetical protein
MVKVYVAKLYKEIKDRFQTEARKPEETFGIQKNGKPSGAYRQTTRRLRLII